MIFEFTFKDHEYFYDTECQFKITYSILEAYWKQNYRCEQIVIAQFFLIFFFIASDVLVNIIMII